MKIERIPKFTDRARGMFLYSYFLNDDQTLVMWQIACHYRLSSGSKTDSFHFYCYDMTCEILKGVIDEPTFEVNEACTNAMREFLADLHRKYPLA